MFHGFLKISMVFSDRCSPLQIDVYVKMEFPVVFPEGISVVWLSAYNDKILSSSSFRGKKIYFNVVFTQSLLLLSMFYQM